MPTEKEWEKITKEKQKRIDLAMGQRERSIAYFNSLNAAINLLGEKAKFGGTTGDNLVRKFIIDWRDWFYQQWTEWYLDNQPTGYDAEPPVKWIGEKGNKMPVAKSDVEETIKEEKWQEQEE